jgi:hypothetical protein
VLPTACEKLKCTRIALLLRANLHEKVELIPADHLKKQRSSTVSGVKCEENNE